MMDRVVVVGGGAAGVAAALSAAKEGVETLLIESESMPGGDLCSGMPILGTYTARGRKVVGGILDDIASHCKGTGGYIGPVFDWRTVCGLCLNPISVQLAIQSLLLERGVKTLLSSMATGVAVEDGSARSVKVAFRNGATEAIQCSHVIDASGGGNIVRMAGGEIAEGDERGNFQPVSLIFRMAGVDFKSLLTFIKDNPSEAILAENPAFPSNPAEAASRLCDSGFPYVAISSKGSKLGAAISAGRMPPCTAMFMTPTSMLPGEVCINATRIAGLDCCDTRALSKVQTELSRQLMLASSFLKEDIPGFANAHISAIAHRTGVRETGRIVGESTLAQSDVVEGRVPQDSICLSCHHVDIHGAGTDQIRIPVGGEGFYGIPFGCLIPKGLKNVIAAGRCLSSDRGAHGSARVMGGCIGTGQATGIAAALAAKGGIADIRDVNESAILSSLKRRGAAIWQTP